MTNRNSTGINIDNIATDLNGKADIDFTNAIGNLSSSSKNYFIKLNNELDWANAITVSTTSNGNWQTYTAPDDGLFLVCVYCTNSSEINTGIDSTNSSNPPISGCTAGNYTRSYAGFQTASEYILSGQTIKYAMYGNANISYISARFIPFKKS